MLGCEIGGKVTLSSDLLTDWNRAAIVKVVAWLFTVNSGLRPPGSLLSILDIRPAEEVGSDPTFEVALRGSGPNGGILSNLEEFTFAPP